MSFNQTPDNIKNKPENVKTKSEQRDDDLRKWWEETKKKLRKNPHYIPFSPPPIRKVSD